MIRRTAARAGYQAAYVGLRVWSALLHPHTRGVKCLVCAGEDILLVRHSYGPRAWDMPGGFARRGEPFLQTARREISEELSLTDPGEPVVIAEFERDHVGRHESLAAVRVEVGAASAAIRGHELLELGWFRRDALPEPRAEIVEEILALERGLPPSGRG